MDSTLKVGQSWAQEIEAQIHQADYVIVFLTEKSCRSEMVQREIEIARQQRTARQPPQILPVRLGYEDSLPYPLNAYLDKLQCARWSHHHDTPGLVRDLLAAMGGGQLVETPVIRPGPPVGVPAPSPSAG